MITRPQVETDAAPAEVNLLGVPSWLVPTVGKAISAAAVLAMFYLQAAEARDERLGLTASPQHGPPNKLREILNLAGRPVPSLPEALAALMGDVPPATPVSAHAGTPGVDPREILAQVQTLLGGAMTPGPAAGPAAGPPSAPKASATAPPNPTTHTPAGAPASAPRPATPAANSPPTHLPGGLISTDHLPRFRPEFTREGASKRPSPSAARPQPAPTPSPSPPSPPSPPASPPPSAAKAEPVSSASPSPPPPTLLELVQHALESSMRHIDTLEARLVTLEMRLAAHDARSARPTAPATLAEDPSTDTPEKPPAAAAPPPPAPSPTTPPDASTPPAPDGAPTADPSDDGITRLLGNAEPTATSPEPIRAPGPTAEIVPATS